jgi:hypothetical protein
MTLAETASLCDGDALNSVWPLPPPRSVEELGQHRLAQEEVSRLATARVVFADYALLRRDFPQLCDSRLVAARPELRKVDAARRAEAVQRLIDAWLVENAGFISAVQAGQTVVNSPIQTTGESLSAFRPPRYGRAAIRPVGGVAGSPGDGLLDVKGIGVASGAVPHHRDHGSGLLPLAEALEEFAFQRLIEKIFCHAGTQFHALPVYAILDLGFDLTLEPEARTAFPAGALVRSAHRRWPGGKELPNQGSAEHQVLTEIELLLRHYGVTSATNSTFRFEETAAGLWLMYRDHPLTFADQVVLRALREAASSSTEAVLRLDGINVQTAYPVLTNPSRAVLVDFGHYEIRKRFVDPLLSMVADRPLMWGGLIRPGEPGFVQPVSELAVPEEELGWVVLPPHEVDRLGYPADYNPFSRLEIFCLDAALRFRRGELDGAGVQAQIEGLVARTTSRWLSPA